MNHTFSSREFNQYTSEAKKAADEGPVIITDRGRAAYVLLNIEMYQEIIREYHSIVRECQTIGDLLAMPGVEDIDIESKLPLKSHEFFREVDFS